MDVAWCSIKEVPYCFPRSSIKFQGRMGQKIADFDPNWAFPECNFSLNFTDGFEMIHKAWCGIEEVPYYFSKSYIKFQGHTGWKIDDLDQIWARLLGRLQLSNPPDLSCCNWTPGSQYREWYSMLTAFPYHVSLCKIRARIKFPCAVITYPCPDFNFGLVHPWPDFSWMITSHDFMWLYLLLIP